jgi:hypothetical protein
LWGGAFATSSTNSLMLEAFLSQSYSPTMVYVVVINSSMAAYFFFSFLVFYFFLALSSTIAIMLGISSFKTICLEMFFCLPPSA